MKKLASFLVLFSLALFTVAPMVGCGDTGATGGDEAGENADGGGDASKEEGAKEEGGEEKSE